MSKREFGYDVKRLINCRKYDYKSLTSHQLAEVNILRIFHWVTAIKFSTVLRLKKAISKTVTSQDIKKKCILLLKCYGAIVN